MTIFHKSFLLLSIIILILSGCATATEGSWVTSQSDGTRMWLDNADPTLTYRWEGPCFDSVAHGNGILYVMQNGSIIDEQPYTAHFGALDENAIVSVSDKDYYVGELNEDKFNGYGVYNKAGEIYIGNFKDSKPNGFASWYKNSVPYYIGMWANGKFHGEGTPYKEDGTVKSGDWVNGSLVQTYVDIQLDKGHYEGYVNNNKPDGNGAMTYANGSVYYGKWKDGKWNGQGTYETADSIAITSNWNYGAIDGNTSITTPEFSYEGDYYDGYPHGYCQIIVPGQYSYVGYIDEGDKTGYGELSINNGDSYKGDWSDNFFDGDGIYTYSSQHATYDGQWHSGLQDGIGYYQCPDFAYRGEWEEGWMNGYGKLVFANKDEYVGNIIENVFHGEGTYLFSNGNKYEGEFIDGKFNGLGTFIFANGDTYFGEFKNGEIYGDGTMTIYENGKPTIITANWPGNNKFPGKGSIIFANGDIYEGELSNGLPTANGHWTTEEAIANNDSWTDKANDFYKNHKEEFDKIATTVTYITVGVTVAATVTAAAIAIASTGGTAAPAALVLTGKVLATAGTVLTSTNTAINIASTTASAVSSAQDYRNSDDENEKNNILKSASAELAINAAFIVVPKIAKSSGARAAKAVLSNSIKTIGNKTAVTISKNKVFGKVITITKKDGIYTKKLSNANRNTVKSSIEKGRQKVESLFLKQLIKRTKLYKQLQAIMDKGAITLSDKELKALLENPKYMRQYIETYTGDRKNFQEFFIRLAMGNKQQVKDILNHPEIRTYIDKRIRQSGEGGVHEWLMTKNFTSFLTDSKWGDDGPFLALALTKLVQRTERVLFKHGGGHPSANNPNSSASVKFHQGLAEIIDSCSSKEELLVRIRAFAKENLTPESYKEFNNIFKTVFTLTDK